MQQTLLTSVLSRLATKKSINDPAVLHGWGWPELFSFAVTFMCRLVRGAFVRWRLKSATGLLLCEKGHGVIIRLDFATN